MQEKRPLLKEIIHIHNIGEGKIYFAALFHQICGRRIYLNDINNLLCLNPK